MATLDEQVHTITSALHDWCIDQGHVPNPKHGATSFCAVAWELGITREDNPDEWAELKALMKAEAR